VVFLCHELFLLHTLFGESQ